MPLNRLPVISQDHPLYDWSDWQSSRDALVSGTPTKYFAKEAWNAIVDDLNSALRAAGLPWDDEYTTASGAKITTAYGKLTATKFNSVRHNINRPAPLSWPWAWKTDFRGFVGREDFRGRQDVGKKCDLVYPEYILELVRRLNLLIEIMRNTALISSADAPQLSVLTLQNDMQVGRAARIQSSQRSSLDQATELRVLPSVSCETQLESSNQMEAEATTKRILPTESRLSMDSNRQAQGRSREALATVPGSTLALSRVLAEMEHNRCLMISLGSVAQTQASIQPNLTPPQPIEAVGLVKSGSGVNLTCADPFPIESSSHSGVISTTEVVEKQRGLVDTAHRSSVVTQAPMRNRMARPMLSASICKLTASGDLDTGWLPPVWVNGGLWIRQVHSDPVTREDGSLEVT